MLRILAASSSLLFLIAPATLLASEDREGADVPKGGANGQAFGSDGRLYAVAGMAGQLLAFDQDGKSTAIAEGIRGNDLVVGHRGAIHVTQPGEGGEPSVVWHVDPSGEKRVVDRGLKYANGITLSHDQSLLYVADYASQWVYSYQIQPDGSLAHKQRYDHLHVPDDADDSGADGMCVDREGRLYVATRMGVQVCDQAGPVNGIIPAPNGVVSNVRFGGEDFHTLFATCGDRVYRRRLKVAGAQAYQPPIMPAPPRL
jgi:sugar lactone lactonase YvrE